MSDDWSKTIFREEAEELLTELETTLLELEEQTEDANLINRVFRALHTIKGSGAMFGFDDIAEFSHEVETLFDRVRSGELVVTRGLLDAAFKARDHIANLLDNSLSDEQKQAALASLKQELSVAAVDSPSPAAPEPDKVVEEQDSPDEFVLLEGSSEEGKGASDAGALTCVYHIDIRPRAGTLPEEFPLEPLFEELRSFGEVTVEELKTSSGGSRWEVSIVTDRDEDEVRDVFFFADVDLDVSVTCSDPELEAESVSSSAQQEQPVVELDLSMDEAKQAEPPQKECKEHPAPELPPEQPLPEKANSLRVNASKLDKLVDLVGELVIIQSQLSRYAAERADASLVSLSEGLDRLAEELRDTTLGVRMIPIGTTFSKFRRLVRDLNTELGKNVEFLPTGADTELDKTVIESLSDPLVHLLRNSMDHGIETSQERVAAGKSEHGTISLSAEHSGGEVLIRMTDDGRGIDPNVVRRKAEEAGLIEPQAELSRRELFSLLFVPGFSTAREVTSLSGRGVGMDVVRQAIESLRGSIIIDSEPGVGTSMTIKLPLTLAIIDGLQVRTEEEIYVIPLTQVQECVELMNGHLREKDGSRLLDLRGEIVPYVNLREWFDIPGIRPALEQVIITTVDKKRVGIVVDDVVGEHQTVIKTLGRIYRDVEGISGATVLGDGSVSLILDIPDLIHSVTELSARSSS